MLLLLLFFFFLIVDDERDVFALGMAQDARNGGRGRRTRTADEDGGEDGGEDRRDLN